MAIYYFLLVMLTLTTLLSYYTDRKVIKINKRKVKLNTAILYLTIGILYLVSSFRYGIGNDYTHYQAVYTHGAYSTYEWLFSLLCEVGLKLGFTFHGFVFILNLFVYVPLTLLIDKCVNEKYKLYSVLMFYIYNFYGASFNYIRQFPAIVICLAFSYFCWIGYKKISSKAYSFVLMLLMAVIAVGFHKTIIVAFLVVVIARLNIINKSNVMAISAAFIILAFINPFGFIINGINDYIIANVPSYLDAAWNNRLLNTGASLINRALFFPIIVLSSMILMGENDVDNQFDRSSVTVTYLYYLLMSMDIGSEMLDRILLPLYMYNIFSFPIFIEKIRNRKCLKFALYFGFIAIGIFILMRQLNANVYHIVPYRTK